MLVGAWSTGLVLIVASVAYHRSKLAITYILAGGTLLTLYLVATNASPLPWRVFVPIQSNQRWVTAAGAISLALFLISARLATCATAAVRMLRIVTSLAVTIATVIAIRQNSVALNSGARVWTIATWIGLALGLACSWSTLLACALNLIDALSAASDNRRFRLASRLMLTALLLLFVWGIVGPAIAAGSIATILGPLNNQILLAGASLVIIEGIVYIAAQALPRRQSPSINQSAAPSRLGHWVAAAVSLLIVFGIEAAAPKKHLAQDTSLAGSIPLKTGDWSQWCGGPDRNMVSGEKGLPISFDEFTTKKTSNLTNVKWVVKLGAQTMGSPVISGGKVFIGGSLPGHAGVLWCFRESDGKLLWRMRSPYITGLYGDSFGICATPTVESDRVFLPTHLGDVLCLNANGMADGNLGPFKDEANYFASDRSRTKSEIAQNGSRIVEWTEGQPATLGPLDADVIWKFDMLREVNCWPFNAVNASILIRGDRLYAATCSTISEAAEGSTAATIEAWKKQNQKQGYDSPSLIVLDKNTGKLLAREEEGIFDHTFHGAHSSPALGVINGRELLIYGSGGGTCYAFDPNFSPEPDGKPGKLKLVWKFDCLAAASYGPTFRVERLKNAEILATPVIHNNRIYVSIGNDLIHSGAEAGAGRLICIDATQAGDVTSTGRLWSFDDMRSSSSTVAIADGLLYTADASGVIYCFDAETGKLYWTHTTTPVWSSPLVADGKVYVGTHLHGLLIFAHSKEKKLLSNPMPTGDIVASPTAANGTLYVANHRYLYALQQGKTGGLVAHGD